MESFQGIALPDEFLDEYRVLGILGRGGMGVVLRAAHLSSDQVVAVKFLSPGILDSDLVIKRFFREAALAVGLRHGNIVRGRAVGQDPKHPYVVFELMQGGSLADILAKGHSFSPDRALDIVMSIAAGLSYAHERGVVHRDLKPDNIFLTKAGEPKIGDFGLASVAREVERLTRTGLIMGTPAYMAPEQIKGETVDARADLYALAEIAYFLFCGSTAFPDVSPAELFRLKLAASCPSLRLKNPELPPHISRAVMKALNTEPDERQSSVAEFAEAIAQCAGRNGACKTVCSVPAPGNQAEPRVIDGAGRHRAQQGDEAARTLDSPDRDASCAAAVNRTRPGYEGVNARGCPEIDRRCIGASLKRTLLRGRKGHSRDQPGAFSPDSAVPGNEPAVRPSDKAFTGRRLIAVAVAVLLLLPAFSLIGVEKGPEISSLHAEPGSFGVLVEWCTSFPVAGRIELWRAGEKKRVFSRKTGNGIKHSVSIKELRPDSEYNYRVYAGDSVGVVHSFRTLKFRGKIRFLTCSPTQARLLINSSDEDVSFEALVEVRQAPYDQVFNTWKFSGSGAKWSGIVSCLPAGRDLRARVIVTMPGLRKERTFDLRTQWVRSRIVLGSIHPGHSPACEGIFAVIRDGKASQETMIAKTLAEPVDGMLVMALQGNGIHCYDWKARKTAWTLDEKDFPVGELRISGDRFFCLDRNSRMENGGAAKRFLRAYSLSKRRRIWKSELPSKTFEKNYIAVGSSVIVFVARGGLVCYRAVDGTVAWSLDDPDIHRPVVATAGGMIFCRYSDALMAAIDIQSGKRLKAHDIYLPGRILPEVRALYADGRIFVFGENGYLNCFDTKAGKGRERIVRSIRIGKTAEYVYRYGEMIFVTLKKPGTGVCAVDIRNFDRTWYTTLPDERKCKTIPRVFGRYLYVALSKDYFLCLDAQNGNILWQCSGMIQSRFEALAVDEGVLYHSDQGELVLIRDRSPSL